MPDTRFLYFFKSGLSHLSKRKLNAPSLFNWWGTAFVEETLYADLLAMREVYRDRGWLDAVVELERLEFRDDGKGVIIHVAVDEGERYRVSSIGIKGFQYVDVANVNDLRLEAVDLVFPEEALQKKCELKPGALYEKLSVQRDRIALRDFYGDRGYISHPSLPRSVNWSFEEPSLVFDVENHTVEVTYRIVQGRRLRIREILFAGSHHTRDRVLRRELSVFPGQYADLEEINRSLARIQATGYFKDDLNRLEHRDPTFRFIAVPDDPSMVDLQFEVDEGRVVDFNISGGIDSNDGLFGIVSLTMRNFDITDLPSSFWGTFSEIYHKEAFHGAGQLVQLELAPGTQVSRFRIRFLEPDIFRNHLKPVSLDVDLLKRLRRYDSHDEDRFTQSLRLGRKLSYDLWGAIGIINNEVELTSLDPNGVPPGLAQQAAQGKQRYTAFTFDVNKRQLDNVYLPKSGYTARWSNALYGGPLGGAYDFVSSEIHGEYYITAYEREDGTKPVVYIGVDGGVSLPYGDTQLTPYSESYFLGGVRSLRGFEFRGVGPMDPASGYPIGGQTFLSGTVEFQYPLHTVVQPGTYQRLESLRGTIFFDWGVQDPRELTLDADEVRAAVGVGIGLAWPIPIILNFGFPVLDKPGDRKQVFSFNLGF
jgi:outer membrane protein insertion porin family